MSVLQRRHLRRRLLSEVSRNELRTASISFVDGDPLTSLRHLQRLIASGYSLEHALANTAATNPSQEFTEIRALLSRGESMESSCRLLIGALENRKRLSSRDRDALLTFHSLSLAGAIGGRVCEHLDSLIEMLADRAHLRHERAVQTASASASMRMLTWMPLLCGTWMLIDSESVRVFLLQSAAGWMCLLAGIALNAMGRLWLQHEVAAC